MIFPVTRRQESCGHLQVSKMLGLSPSLKPMIVLGCVEDCLQGPRKSQLVPRHPTSDQCWQLPKALRHTTISLHSCLMLSSHFCRASTTKVLVPCIYFVFKFFCSINNPHQENDKVLVGNHRDVFIRKIFRCLT